MPEAGSNAATVDLDAAQVDHYGGTGLSILCCLVPEVFLMEGGSNGFWC
jgi:hypothetical protein